MSLKKLAMVAALGLSMASAPVLAQTAPTRAGAEMVEASNQDNPPRGRGRGRGPVDGDEGGFFGGGTTTYVIAIFVVIVIAIGIFFAFDEDDDGRATP